MNEQQWRIPPSVLRQLERVSDDRALAVLLRHSVRDPLPEGEVANDIPITETGYRLAYELGGLLRGRLLTLHTSPVLRCVQTANALKEGAGKDVTIVQDRLLGDPGVFVLDGELAWSNWMRLGHEGVMEHLVTQSDALPGMARPDEAARMLVKHILSVVANRPGVHVFVSHDLLITAAAARLLGKSLGTDDWPWFLEGAFFWEEKDGVYTTYRNKDAVRVADSDFTGTEGSPPVATEAL